MNSKLILYDKPESSLIKLNCEDGVLYGPISLLDSCVTLKNMLVDVDIKFDQMLEMSIPHMCHKVAMFLRFAGFIIVEDFLTYFRSLNLSASESLKELLGLFQVADFLDYYSKDEMEFFDEKFYCYIEDELGISPESEGKYEPGAVWGNFLNMFSKFKDEEELQKNIKQKREQKVLYEELKSMHESFAEHMKSVVKERYGDQQIGSLSVQIKLDYLVNLLGILVLNLEKTKTFECLLKAKETFPAMKNIIETSKTLEEIKCAIIAWQKLYTEIFNIKENPKTKKEEKPIK